MSSLTPEQRQQIAAWAADGANLNQIQDRLRADFGITLTYMEVRLLLLELGVKLQDKPREKPPEEDKKPEPPPPSPESGEFQDSEFEQPAAGDAPAGELKVTVDEIPLAGALISGKATFSDGNTVVWFMDQMGRFGMRGPAPGYQPPQADIPAFQRELDTLLSVRGF
ncbi:MAG: hypothetical protein HS117_23215 [Verrucomicrobiaceae bacterium]|nr:hypothetical protein [Verrucomicrobiaceae bacterium]MBN8249586.1 hypothetical protein [Verrucomicrobiota bacterium]